MLKQNVSFEEVYDNYAIRIIYKSDAKNEKFIAWKIYSIVTDLYHSNPQRMRDWITNPRSTGYESLHLTVLVQIKNGLKYKFALKEWTKLQKKELLHIINTKKVSSKIVTIEI
jgi:GTP pyrophosphokinase